MQTVSVLLELPDGERVTLRPGAIVGRMPGAAARIEDPRVSEAHALVSLRGRNLKLLALRGGIGLQGRRVPDVTLEAGLTIELARGVAVEVIEVHLPGEVLALDGLGLSPVELGASVYSLMDGPSLTPGFRSEAIAHLWSTAEGWQVRWRDAEAQPIEVGDTWKVDEHELRVVAIPLVDAGATATVAGASFDPPLRIVARFETVHIHPEDLAPLVLVGIPARIVSELVAFEAPVPWEAVAETIWKDADRRTQRQNWDRHLKALRAKLRSAQLRNDLVRSDGRGNVELFLMPGDEVVDEG